MYDVILNAQVNAVERTIYSCCFRYCRDGTSTHKRNSDSFFTRNLSKYYGSLTKITEQLCFCSLQSQEIFLFPKRPD